MSFGFLFFAFTNRRGNAKNKNAPASMYNYKFRLLKKGFASETIIELTELKRKKLMKLERS